MKRVRSMCCCVLLCLSYLVQGQDFSNKGKEFWLAFPSHVNGSGAVMALYITAGTATTGTVQLGTAAPIVFTVQANVVTRVFLNASGTGTASGSGPVYFAANGAVYMNNVTDGVQSSSAIKVTSADPVVVYSHIIFSARSGATLALPTQVLGNEYIVANMNSVSTFALSNNGSMGGRTEFVVVATQDNTTVEITPSINAGSGRQAGVPYTITLPAAGDCYQLQSGNLGDLSGTKIVSKTASGGSCKPVAVFSATTWSAFDCGGSSGGDNLFQQLFPTRSWGKNFVTAPFYNRTDDIFRIFPQASSTVVQIQDNGVVKTLGASDYNTVGKFYTYRTNNPIIITGSSPISVAQYITSASCKTGCATNTNTANCYADPEMVLLNPVEQTLSDITFFSAHTSYVPSGQTQVSLHYVNIIISKSYKSTVKIDNAAPRGTFIDIPGSNYSYLQEDITTSSGSNPVHRITADTSFAAIVYGYGNVESYGYNGGTNIKDFSPKPTFQNTFKRIDSAVTCVNTPFQFSVPISFTPTTIRWDFSAAPNINPNATVQPTIITADSTKTINGVLVNYYSPGVSYSFTKANTTALRDTIKLYTTSAAPDGCGSTDQLFTIPVKVNEAPVADFAITHTGCVSDSVTLADKSIYSSGSLGAWVWDYGDGTTETRDGGAVFNRKYATSGNFSIKLKAISDIGCASAEVTKPILIIEKPVAKFNLPNLLCQDGDITYTDASASSGAPLVKWTWDLGDGSAPFTNTTNAAVTAKYGSYGTRNVSLQVESSTGCKSDSYTQVVKINALPAVGFVVPEICLNDANAQFTDTSSIAEGSNVSWAWQFNAGTPAVSPGPSIATSTAKNPQLKYFKADNYKVSLKVTSDKGCASILVQDFTVNGSTPKAAFELANAAPYCGTKMINLKNTSTVDFGNVTRLEIYWDYTGAATVKQTDETPSPGKLYGHSYPDPVSPKQYTIRMVAYSGGTSCVNEVSNTVTVYPQPKAAFTISASQVCSGDYIDFTDKSKPGSSAAASWAWNLGNGSTAAVQNPSRQYNDSGLMNISMHFTNADGCISDTATAAFTVYPNPQVSLPHKQTVLEGGVITIKPSWIYGNSLRYLWTPATWLSSDTALQPKSTPQNDITYKLIVTAEGGCTATDTTFIRVLKGPEVPNVFSPNGDGINDTWNINYLDGYPGATVDVYNRSGQVVYRSVGYDQPWNGTYQGKPLSVGTYYYIINPRNGRQVITGAVTIIK